MHNLCLTEEQLAALKDLAGDAERDDLLAALDNLSDPQIVVVVQGGLVTGVLCDRPACTLLVDYDTEGADADELRPIPQDGGDTVEEAVASEYAVEIDGRRVAELFAAVNGAVA
jgi:hypothetical protein